MRIVPSEKMRYLLLGLVLGSVLMLLVLGRYSLMPTGANAAYKTDRLTGRVWQIHYSAEYPVKPMR